MCRYVFTPRARAQCAVTPTGMAMAYKDGMLQVLERAIADTRGWLSQLSSSSSSSSSSGSSSST